MKKIIEGKTYNTETAIKLCQISTSAESVGDFNWHHTHLYRTKKGVWFIAGRGGPMSMWAVSSGNSTSGGSDLHLVTAAEARSYMEQEDVDEQVFIDNGFTVEEG